MCRLCCARGVPSSLVSKTNCPDPLLTALPYQVVRPPPPPFTMATSLAALFLALFLAIVAGSCNCDDGNGNAVGSSSSIPAAGCTNVQACGLPDGVYWVQPATTVYQTQCAGGFALAMQIDGTQSTFTYSASYWTNSALLNANAVNSGTWQEAKLQTFVDTPGTSVKIIMCNTGGSCGSSLTVSVGAYTSLLSLFSGGAVYTSASVSSWLAAVPGGAQTQPNCNLQGVNVLASQSCPNTGQRIGQRIGLLMNGENDCCTCDTQLGIGGKQDACSIGPAGSCNSPMRATVWVGNADFVAPSCTTTPSSSVTPSVTPSNSPTSSNTPSNSPSPSVTPSGTYAPGCDPSAYRLLPYSNLVGTVTSATLHVPTERDCQLACCSAPPPACVGYTWGAHLPDASCFLYGGNVTAYTSNVVVNSGVLWAAAPVGASPY